MRLEENEGSAGMAESVIVSPEMIAMFGPGDWRDATDLADRLTLTFVVDRPDAPGLLRVGAGVAEDAEGWQFSFLVSRAAVARLGGRSLAEQDEGAFHLTGDMRAMAALLRDPPTAAEARATYRLAKSIELLCEVIGRHQAGDLVPTRGDGDLSAADTRRVLAARRMIDERWTEKLTLDGIARACGLNRSKLSRGFRELFSCSVADALAARRLSQASRLLLTTDLPVSLVGYEAGYLNNASFARAFGRRFGRTPSSYRSLGVAA